MRKQKELFSTTVTALHPLSEGVFVLEFEKLHPFKAGQVLAVALQPNEEPRLYSILSGENDSTMQILFDIHPQGLLTPRLAQLKPGDMLWTSAPFGKFLVSPKASVWIAAGTGIAPFISMLRSADCAQNTLLHSAKTPEGLFFRNEIAKAMPNYHCFCTRIQTPGIHHMRITEYLKTQHSLDPDQMYYLCGSNQMVLDVREILLQRQISFNHIVAEIYF